MSIYQTIGLESQGLGLESTRVANLTTSDLTRTWKTNETNNSKLDSDLGHNNSKLDSDLEDNDSKCNKTRVT